VESHRFLDVGRLSTMECLWPGWTGTYYWQDGKRVSLHTDAERRLHLFYTAIGDVDRGEIIPLVRVPCRFDGSRAYFICPGSGGSQCGRRTTRLYLSRGYFLCRHCNHLAYASQYEQVWERAIRRPRKGTS
jgi:hypothetical protein